MGFSIGKRTQESGKGYHDLGSIEGERIEAYKRLSQVILGRAPASMPMEALMIPRVLRRRGLFYIGPRCTVYGIFKGRQVSNNYTRALQLIVRRPP